MTQTNDLVTKYGVLEVDSNLFGTYDSLSSVSSNLFNNTLTTGGNTYYTQSGNTCATSAPWPSAESLAVNLVLVKTPPILNIISVSKISDNKLEIHYSKISHKRFSKYLKYNGAVYFENGIYGVYDKQDNFYWNNRVIVEFENSADLESIKPNLHFIQINNWDSNITNEETVSFLDNFENYSKFAHKELEKILNEKIGEDEFTKKEYAHHNLDTQLI